MSQVSDEMISAWLDGELTSSDMLAVETAITSDPELAARVARLARATRVLAAGFSPVVSEAIPDRLDRILSQRRPFRAGDQLRSWFAGFGSPIVWATAGAALTVGVAIGSIWTMPRSVGERAVVASEGSGVALGGKLAAQLKALPSGVGAAADHISISLTLKDAAGRYCRQFSTTESVGIACREGDVWRLEALAATPELPDGADLYVMAEGASDPAIEAALARIGVAYVLDAGEEAMAIASDWSN